MNAKKYYKHLQPRAITKTAHQDIDEKSMGNQHTPTETTRNIYANKRGDYNTNFRSQAIKNQESTHARNETPRDQEANTSRSPSIAKKCYQYVSPRSLAKRSRHEILPIRIAKKYNQERSPRNITKDSIR